jgi:serine/threonine protein kinase
MLQNNNVGELFYLFNPTSIDNESIRSSYYTNLEKMIGNTEKMGNVILGVTNALKFIHERHIAHSDIKLENICLSKDGIAKLVDFVYAVMFIL